MGYDVGGMGDKTCIQMFITKPWPKLPLRIPKAEVKIRLKRRLDLSGSDKFQFWTSGYTIMKL
jgi:hypothetical protein